MSDKQGDWTLFESSRNGWNGAGLEGRGSAKADGEGPG